MLPAHGQTVYPEYVDGHVYLKVKDSSLVVLDPYVNNIPALDLILATLGVDSMYRAFKTPSPILERIYRLELINPLNVDLLILQLQALTFVELVEKVPLMTLPNQSALTPNDLHALQWGLVKIDAPLAWGVTTGSSQVKVAVVDNACFGGHEDLSGVIWTNPGETPNNLLDDDLNGFADDSRGYDVADMDGNPSPPTGIQGWDHGSHCSGIVGAATDNGLGIASIGYGVSVIPVKATNDVSGGNTLTKAYEGVDYAMRAGADVISMSWGSTGNSSVGQLLINFAQSQGIVLVAAAGNNNDSIPFYPASYPACIAVGSTDQADLRSGFSNYGSYVDVMAPGTDILSCLASGTNHYGLQSGTSMACPLVAGLAGLLLSHTPSLTAQQVRDAIVAGCVDIDALNPGFEGKLGAGRINAFNSLNSLTAVTAPQGSQFIVYPNPSTGAITIASAAHPAADGITCKVMNLSGMVVAEQDLGLSEGRLDLALPDGMYLLECTLGGVKEVSKLVIRR